MRWEAEQPRHWCLASNTSRVDTPKCRGGTTEDSHDDWSLLIDWQDWPAGAVAWGQVEACQCYRALVGYLGSISAGHRCRLYANQTPDHGWLSLISYGELSPPRICHHCRHLPKWRPPRPNTRRKPHRLASCPGCTALPSQY